MAAGAKAASGGSFEATLERKFRTVSNTMDSIQGLSTWCIDNKKYHSLIVRHWMKCLKKSDSAHRLNLLYVANDVIQNCKRKNAIVYRTAFAELLPDAFLLVSHEGDSKVHKSVERILSIWEERDVYSGALIAELKNILTKEDSPPAEQQTPVESKADLRSKVLAEFVPQALLDQLSKYKRSLEEVDLREKQLAAMRVDIFSTDALKKLKDKTGGKKFSKDFEEGSAQLHEFVKFFEKQMKTGPQLLEALTNADIFYEMQYKEVKIVANAYQTFANRVSHLKRKLDALKASLPDLDDSPIPSPSADAPSPTGSESPFHGLELARPDPDLDGSAMDDDAEPPAPSPLSSPGASPRNPEVLGGNDNREVEDMDLSDEEADDGRIIVEEQIKSAPLPKVSTPVTAKICSSAATDPTAGQVLAPPAPFRAAVETATYTGPTIEKPPPAAPVVLGNASSLVSLLSKVDVSPADLLSALSKVQSQTSLQGMTTMLNSPAADVPECNSADKITPSPLSTSPAAAPLQSPSLSFEASVPSSVSSTQPKASAPHQTSNKASALVQALHRDMDLTAEPETPSSSSSLDSKIHSFLKGNPAFSAFDLGFSSNSAQGGSSLSTDTQGGTPVRDEGGGTPTQDEILDKPAVAPFASSRNVLSVGEAAGKAPLAFDSLLPAPAKPQQQTRPQPGTAQNGQVYQPYPGAALPAAPYQQVSSQAAAPGCVANTQNVGGFPGANDRNWYGNNYKEGGSQQPGGYHGAVTDRVGENKPSGVFPFQTEPTQDLQRFAPQQVPTAAPSFFTSTLPPVPKLPPPPPIFDNMPPPTSNTAVPPEQLHREEPGLGRDSALGGMVVMDHQHKSLLHSEDPMYDADPWQPHPPEDLHYQEGPEQYHNNARHDFPHETFYPHEEPFFPPGNHQPFPRGRGRPVPPIGGDSYYDFQQRPPPPQFMPRRPPPLHEHRHPGPRPLHRPPHPRGPPHLPFQRFHGPEPRLRVKRPGPRGGGPMFAPKRPFLPPRF
ncbi:regulation of nuclear pre-mRNA domain-containing protein 2 isoform X1 [Oryzias latipes]|uniref:Regulation of nuclear pre-mRNA domain-containing protein 2 n=1 Tax=Oryzias latipes TaxID=8090 RepID=A0A3B3I671_ORYLA|nr:regulation of nuclear pre-mRNA domain-containing protein 2 isoform X1 [Oryzias latipes]